MPYKNHKHQSIYLDEKLDKRITDAAVSEKKSKNKMINELIRIGLSKRDEEMLGLEAIAKSIKADLQLQRDELRKQSNRIATLLSKVGLHSIAARYQVTHIHAKLTDGEAAKKNAESGWQYAVSKLKETARESDDSKE
jgi:hypothetical protein